MRTILNFSLISILTILVLLLVFLSTTGIETKRFNNLITKKIKANNAYIDLNLNTIKFKVDLKEISLFLEAKNPSINFKEITLPVNDIKAYVNFLSLIKSENKFEKISLNFNQINFKKVKNISTLLKPSNFSSFLNNKLVEGKLNIEIDFFFNKNNVIENFITRGSIEDAKINFEKEIFFEGTNFTFFADKTDILITSFLSKFGPLNIKDGDAKIQISPEISIETNFLSNIKISNNFNKEYKILNKFLNLNSLDNLSGKFNNSLKINLDKTLKIKSYNFKNKGKIENAKFNFQNSIENFLLEESPKFVTIKDAEINTLINFNQKNINTKGKYSFDNKSFLDFKLENIIKKEILKFKIKADIDEKIEIDLINYVKPKKKIATISFELEKLKDNLKFKYLDYNEGENSIIIEDLELRKGKFLNLKKVSIKTFDKQILNNDFTISLGNKIIIAGDKFDASNLPKVINQKKKNNNLKKLNQNIKINIDIIIAPLCEKLTKFRLIGKIEKGKFTKFLQKVILGITIF